MKREIEEPIVVEKADLLTWRQEWLEENRVSLDEDQVTPFDHYLYGGVQYLKGKVEVVSHGRCATVTKTFPNLWYKIDAACSGGLFMVLHRAEGRGALARCRKWAEERGYQLKDDRE